jgi:hypothetical protein
VLATLLAAGGGCCGCCVCAVINNYNLFVWFLVISPPPPPSLPSGVVLLRAGGVARRVGGGDMYWAFYFWVLPGLFVCVFVCSYLAQRPEAVSAAPSAGFGDGPAARCWHCVYPDRKRLPLHAHFHSLAGRGPRGRPTTSPSGGGSKGPAKRAHWEKRHATGGSGDLDM